MIVTTTNNIDGKMITDYKGLVFGDTIVPLNIAKNLFGNASQNYEDDLLGARRSALEDVKMKARRAGADAVVGISFNYQLISQGGTFLLVSVSGTAVSLKDANVQPSHEQIEHFDRMESETNENENGNENQNHPESRNDGYSFY